MNGTLRKYCRQEAGVCISTERTTFHLLNQKSYSDEKLTSPRIPKLLLQSEVSVLLSPETTYTHHPSCRNEVQIKMPLLKNNRASDSKFHSPQHCIVQFPIHTYAHARFSARFESAAVFIQGEQGERRGRPKLIPARGRRRRERTAAGQSRIMPVYESVRFERVCFDIVSRLEQLSVACWL